MKINTNRNKKQQSKNESLEGNTAKDKTVLPSTVQHKALNQVEIKKKYMY